MEMIWQNFAKLAKSFYFCDHVSCKTTSEAWFALEHYFITVSKARIVNLKNALMTLKKGSLNMHEYVHRMKDIFDALMSSGQNISEDKLINYILDGLRPKFESVVMHIMARIDTLVEKLKLSDLKLIL